MSDFTIDGPSTITPDDLYSTASLIESMCRQSITDHGAPNINHNGRDITHHEPVDFVQVCMSPSFLSVHLQGHKPRQVDGTPIVYAEKPPPAQWDLQVMCHYTRNGRPARSRGRLVRGPMHKLKPGFQ